MKKQIKGFEDYWIDTEGKVWSEKSGKMKQLKGRESKNGYLRVILYSNKKYKNKLIHRLVALAFLENKDNHSQVNHKNGIKTDNRLKNLEWCSASYNIIHAFDNGLKDSMKGEKHGRSKLTENDISIIRERLSNKEKQIDIARDYGVGQSAISKIKRNAIWSHLKY